MSMVHEVRNAKSKPSFLETSYGPDLLSAFPLAKESVVVLLRDTLPIMSNSGHVIVDVEEGRHQRFITRAVWVLGPNHQNSRYVVWYDDSSHVSFTSSFVPKPKFIEKMIIPEIKE